AGASSAAAPGGPQSRPASGARERARGRGPVAGAARAGHGADLPLRREHRPRARQRPPPRRLHGRTRAARDHGRADARRAARRRGGGGHRADSGGARPAGGRHGGAVAPGGAVRAAPAAGRGVPPRHDELRRAADRRSAGDRELGRFHRRAIGGGLRRGAPRPRFARRLRPPGAAVGQPGGGRAGGDARGGPRRGLRRGGRVAGAAADAGELRVGGGRRRGARGQPPLGRLRHPPHPRRGPCGRARNRQHRLARPAGRTLPRLRGVAAPIRLRRGDGRPLGRGPLRPRRQAAGADLAVLVGAGDRRPRLGHGAGRRDAEGGGAGGPQGCALGFGHAALRGPVAPRPLRAPAGAGDAGAGSPGAGRAGRDGGDGARVARQGGRGGRGAGGGGALPARRGAGGGDHRAPAGAAELRRVRDGAAGRGVAGALGAGRDGAV
ncbi:MAG: hypothetical protein AVDCRST_MAG04-1642, partial [uncultured Acetobacteraceae bacterium]